jgi:hypothetical protein
MSNPVADYAIATTHFALATNHAAMHKDLAFQASSPKTFKADPSGVPGSALFFVRAMRYSDSAVVVPNHKVLERTPPGNRHRYDSSMGD